jgi:hypothetical protein
MKTKLVTFVAIGLLGLMIAGCAYHNGIMTNSASLSQNNFKIVKFAKGESNTMYILGIGGLGKDAMVAEAKKNLLENFPLKEGQALANTTVDFKTSYFLIVFKNTVTMTADIVEFK